jgi:hypothetical protein
LPPRDPGDGNVLGGDFEIDLDKNHEDISVTCSHEGFRTRTVAASYAFQPIFGGDGYPEIMRVPLKHENSE